MDRPLRIEILSLRFILIMATGATGIVGCGGGESAPASTSPADSSAMVPSTGMGSPAVETSPPKELKNGMTLPDEVPISPVPKPDASNSSGPDSSKGMQLPDDLTPATSSRSLNPTSKTLGSKTLGSKTLVSKTLVSTSSSEHSSKHSVDLRFATWEQLRNIASSTGKVTVVDLWSLSCTPCLKKFPKLVDLQRRYPDRIEAIGANADFDGRRNYPPACYRDDVEQFLGSVRANFPNFILETPSEDLYRKNQIASLPAVFVFARNGDLVKTFCDAGATRGFTYQDDIVPLIERLLN